MGDNKPIEMNLRKLIEKSGKTRREIAKGLGCDVSTITKHYNENRNIRADFIIKYANYFNVSTDYLLGLDDTPTNDKDLAFVCKYTGLNDNVVDNIAHNPEIVEILNYLLSDEKIFDLVLLCVNLEAYRRKTAEFAEYKKSVLSSADDNSLSSVEIWEKEQDYINSNDLKEFQTQKVFKTIQNSLFDFFNSRDKDVDKDFEELLKVLWEKNNGNNSEAE